MKCVRYIIYIILGKALKRLIQEGNGLSFIKKIAYTNEMR